jgi:hypothetical protein
MTYKTGSQETMDRLEGQLGELAEELRATH